MNKNLLSFSVLLIAFCFSIGLLAKTVGIIIFKLTTNSSTGYCPKLF